MLQINNLDFCKVFPAERTAHDPECLRAVVGRTALRSLLAAMQLLHAPGAVAWLGKDAGGW